MPIPQGSLELLDTPIAQALLQSKVPAHLAYNWRDGTPRVIPIGFHWNGQELVIGTPPDAPKVKVLTDGTPVAVTIDTAGAQSHVLMIRGVVRTDEVEGLAPEYVAMVKRTNDTEEGARAWLDFVGGFTPRMVRIFIKPTWVGLIDFTTRMPSAVERGMQRTQ